MRGAAVSRRRWRWTWCGAITQATAGAPAGGWRMLLSTASDHRASFSSTSWTGNTESARASRAADSDVAGDAGAAASGPRRPEHLSLHLRVRSQVIIYFQNIILIIIN